MHFQLSEYKSCTLWMDHSSKFLYGHLQESTSTKETLLLKEAFESFAKHYDVRICHICSDNGIFASSNFAMHAKTCGQKHTFCSVGAHWQNGVIEWYIGVITNHAHTMLLHAMNTWPDTVTAKCWSFAFKHNIHLHNLHPNAAHDNKCPYEMFTSEELPHHLSDFCVFGCSVFIVKKNHADNNRLAKCLPFCQHTKPKLQGGLAFVTVKQANGKTQTLLNKGEMEETLLEHSHAHFAKVEGSLFMMDPLCRLLQYDSLALFGNIVYKGKNALNNYQFNKPTMAILQNLRNKIPTGESIHPLD